MDKSSTAAASVMLATKHLHDSPAGGRELLCRLNCDALRAIYDDRFTLFEFPMRRVRGGRAAINAFYGHIDGLNDVVIAEALRQIQLQRVKKLFVDGSNLGLLVKCVKRQRPEIEIIVFFHNVETRFFWGAFRQARSARALAVLVANYLAERNSVRYSDKRICLSARDSQLLRKMYGRAATHVSPLAMQDKLPADYAFLRKRRVETFSLFVGGAFYANRAGIAWFVENVAPRIDTKVYIVGRGFEEFKSQLERPNRVTVVGPVASLAQWYINAQFVIAPIFDGSGMKTKVAEALMFGKKVIGTPEAFAGYEDIADQAGWICNSADDFVSAIEQANAEVDELFDPMLRSLYQTRYSYIAAQSRLAQIVESG